MGEPRWTCGLRDGAALRLILPRSLSAAAADSPHLGRLTALDLAGNPLDKRFNAVKALCARFGAAVRLGY